jgi:hypothetical protein
MASTIYEVITPFCNVSSPVYTVSVRDYKAVDGNNKTVIIINKVAFREMIKQPQ